MPHLTTRARDALLAATVFAASAGNVVASGASPVSLGVVAAASAALVVRRSRPTAVLAAVAALDLASVVLHDASVLLASLFAFYAAAAFQARRRGLVVAAGASAAILAAVLLDGSDRPSSTPAIVALFAAAFALGDNARLRREREADTAQRAVLDERARIARELHDVVTHNVSVMVVQASAGNDIFEARPDLARDALANVEETGRRALAELRSLLHVVGSPGAAPTAGLHALEPLLEQVRSTGLDVELAVEGARRELPTAVDLSAYRVIQESLTNTLKHARATHARVLLRYEDARLGFQIEDDGVGAGAAPPEGRGLAGMRERVAVLGGTLAVRARSPRGLIVAGWIPTETA